VDERKQIKMGVFPLETLFKSMKIKALVMKNLKGFFDKGKVWKLFWVIGRPSKRYCSFFGNNESRPFRDSLKSNEIFIEHTVFLGNFFVEVAE
jgi:hypothetical protein